MAVEEDVKRILTFMNVDVLRHVELCVNSRVNSRISVMW
jgi:hypothetical protein